MARIVFDPAIRVISGGVGGFVYRQNEDGSVTVSKGRLPNPDRVFSQAQLNFQQAFIEAVAHCDQLMQDPNLVMAYQRLVDRRGPRARLRATIIGDILKPPTIDGLYMTGYLGAVGNTIPIQAQDNMGVARLSLVIRDETTGQQLETAERVKDGDPLSQNIQWLYTTKTAVPTGHTVSVSVSFQDLAGNTDQTSQSLVM